MSAQNPSHQSDILPPSPETLSPISQESPSSSGSGKSWLIVLGLLLLLVGGGFGWRWWQSIQAGPSAAAQSAPQGVPVGLEAVQRGPIEESSDFIGNLESPNSVTLRPDIEGRISRIYVASGDAVTAGTPIIQLRPDQRQAEFSSVLASINLARASRASAASELQALQAEQASAVAEVELQEAEYRRTETLVEQGVFARQELDVAERDRQTAIADFNAITQRIQASRASLAEADAALQQAEANAAASNALLQDTTVSAPFAGIVGDIPVKIGDIVDSSTALTSVTQNQTLELRLSIPLERQADLRPGLPVQLTDQQGNSLAIGQISFVSPQVDAAAQSILAKATFNNQGRLLNGQYVRASVIWNQSTGILVPTAAISRLGGQTFVFVAQEQPGENGQPPLLVASQRQVTLGALQGNRYQVLDGLQAGEQIVVSGILNLSDGVPIVPAEADPSVPGTPPNQG